MQFSAIEPDIVPCAREGSVTHGHSKTYRNARFDRDSCPANSTGDSQPDNFGYVYSGALTDSQPNAFDDTDTCSPDGYRISHTGAAPQ